MSTLFDAIGPAHTVIDRCMPEDPKAFGWFAGDSTSSDAARLDPGQLVRIYETDLSRMGPGFDTLPVCFL